MRSCFFKFMLIFVLCHLAAPASAAIQFRNFSDNIQLTPTNSGHYLLDKNTKVKLTNRIIIKTEPTVTKKEILQSDKRIMKVTTLYKLTDSTYYTVTADKNEDINDLLGSFVSLTFVSLVQPDLLQLHTETAGKALHNTPPDYIQKSGIPSLWEKTKGEGIRIAIIDDGFDLSHEDLQGTDVAFGYDMDTKTFDPSPAYTADTHGTRVAGVIFAQHNGLGTDGIAPRAQLIASTMTVGEIGVESYMYRLNDGYWSDEKTVQTPLSITVDEEGTYTLEVTGKNRSGIWQRESESTVLKWRVDFTAPVARLINAPTGTYHVRVINKNGRSLAAAATFTITEAPAPMPVVTAVTPIVIPIERRTPVTIEGENFGKITGVNLIAPDGSTTPLDDVDRESAETITATVDVPAGSVEGQYIIQVVHADGTGNEINAVRMELYDPVDLSNKSGALTTTRMVKPAGGLIPVQTTLTTDDRDEVDGVRESRAEISVTFKPGTILETQNENQGWTDYDGLVNPPRQIPLTREVEENLGTDSVLFTLGAEGFLRLKDGGTLFAEIDIALPADAPVPSVYYVSPDGSITLAVSTEHETVRQSNRGEPFWQP